MTAGLDAGAGGPPASAVATSVALRNRGVASSFAYVDVPGCETASTNADVLRSAGVEVYGFPVTRATRASGVRWGISLPLAIWLLLNAHRFDVLHMHGAWTFTTVAGLVAARLRGRVAVLSTHESLTDYDRSKSGPLHSAIKQLLRWLYVRSFDVVVVASNLEQRDMGDRTGHRSVVVPHAVPQFSDSGLARSSGHGPFCIGFLGRLHPKKNLELLIDALVWLPQHALLHVAGDGPHAYREGLITRAKSRGVDTRIRWLGFVEGTEKRKFLESIDVLAMPSSFEGFGIAAAEALSAGLPVVVAPRVGIADIVVDYGCGRVVVEDAHQLATALRALMRDGGARQELSRNARIAASREFAAPTHAERLTAEYQSALRARARREPSRP